MPSLYSGITDSLANGRTCTSGPAALPGFLGGTLDTALDAVLRAVVPAAQVLGYARTCFVKTTRGWSLDHPGDTLNGDQPSRK
jgi:hypothetical protein